jgi:hypothetical protein
LVCYAHKPYFEKNSCIIQLIGPDREKSAEEMGNKNFKFTCRRGASQLERLCQLYILPATEGKVCQLQREKYANFRGKDMPATEGGVCQLQREGYANSEGRVGQLEREGYASHRGKGIPATKGRVCEPQKDGYAIQLQREEYAS